eukprot:gene9024-16669_t
MDDRSPLVSPKPKKIYKLYKWRWVVLGLFSLISMSNEVIWISLSSITSIVKDYYNVDINAVNWLSMIFGLFFVAFIIPASYLLDKYGLKITIIVGAILDALGSCLRAMGANQDGFTLVFIGTTLAALGQCFVLSIPPRVASVWFGENERATASSIAILMNLSGAAVAFLLAGTLVPSSKNMNDDVRRGMHRLLVSQAVFCTILAVASFFLIKREPLTPPSRSQEMVLKIKRQDFVKEIVDSSEDDFRTSNNAESGNVNSAINESAHNTETSFFFQEDNPDDTKLIKGTKESIVERVPSFGQSILILIKDVQFHLIAQSYSISGCQFIIYNTLLNQMVISKYPGKEKEIGYMGFTTGLCGMFGLLCSGILLDRTKLYKSLSVAIFAACASLMLLFSLLLEFVHSFLVIFLIFCAFGFFSNSFINIGLEYAAEITYPVPEGTTSGIIFLLANLYGIIWTFLLSFVIKRCGGHVGGYCIAASYTISLILVLFVSAPLKRSQVDQNVPDS